MRALIVGGTHGLGFQLACESLARGIEPIVTGRGAMDGEMNIDGVKTLSVKMDVEDEDSVARGIARLRTEPSLDIRYLFYLPAFHLLSPFVSTPPDEIERLFRVTILGMMHVVRHVHQMKKKPYHFVPIGSTTAWRVRTNEAAYAAAKAAQAKFAYDFHIELVRDLPGSKTLLAQPGGMKTELWDGTSQDTTYYLDPALVAKIIWDEIRDQELHDPVLEHGMRELNIIREPDGTPRLERGAKAMQ